MRHLLQDRIARGSAHAVVDVPEPLQIDDDQGQAAVAVARRADAARQAIEK
jgi:hypothetical protein